MQLIKFVFYFFLRNILHFFSQFGWLLKYHITLKFLTLCIDPTDNNKYLQTTVFSVDEAERLLFAHTFVRAISGVGVDFNDVCDNVLSSVCMNGCH